MAQPLSPGARLGAGTWRLLGNVLGLTRDVLLAPLEARIDRTWVGIRLDRGLVEASTTPPWLAELRSRPMLLGHVLDGLERAARDSAVSGVALRVGSVGLGWAQVTALARAVEALREAGKRVVVYAETTGNAGAWLGALADAFWVAPGGRVDLLGIRLEQPFLRGLLDRIGVRPEVLPAGRYKSAGELLSHSSMSEPSRR